MKKKILIILITIILTFLIYKKTFHKDNYLMALGDGSCIASTLYGAKLTSFNDLLSEYLNAVLNKDFCYDNLKVSELIMDIKNNRSIANNPILNELDKANYVTLMIGFDELTSYKRVDNIIKKEFLDNYNELLKLLRKNTKGTIMVIGFYPSFFAESQEITKKIENICKNNDIVYVDSRKISENSSNFFKEYYYKLSIVGNRLLFDIIREKL